MGLTDNERALLVAIRDSEYNDHTGLAPVWVDCIWGFEGKPKFGGTMASLSIKKLAETDGECCWLTKAGLELIGAPETPEYRRRMIQCPRCGSWHDEKQSCLCFDNNCQ